MKVKTTKDYPSKEEVNEMIESALRRHNRRSTIISKRSRLDSYWRIFLWFVPSSSECITFFEFLFLLSGRLITVSNSL